MMTTERQTGEVKRASSDEEVVKIGAESVAKLEVGTDATPAFFGRFTAGSRTRFSNFEGSHV